MEAQPTPAARGVGGPRPALCHLACLIALLFLPETRGKP